MGGSVPIQRRGFGDGSQPDDTWRAHPVCWTCGWGLSKGGISRSPEWVHWGQGHTNWGAGARRARVRDTVEEAVDGGANRRSCLGATMGLLHWLDWCWLEIRDQLEGGVLGRHLQSGARV